MNCADCQTQIFEGELDRATIVHITECADCRALDREVRLNSAALAELRNEVIPVRAARRRWPWVAAAAAAVIIAAVSWPTAPAPVPSPPVAVLRPVPAAPVMPSVVKAQPVRQARRPRPKPAPQTAEPLMVKFFTDDPDVVIYWLIDPPKGEIGL